jgi:DNA-binding beta-propeller fold protein YncE
MEMKRFINRINFAALVVLSAMMVSCRKDIKPIPEQQETLLTPDPSATVKGFYIVNEGNMNMNKASLDYMDYTTGIFRRNIYNKANPEVVKGLGDVGNDIGVYGSKLYVVVNISNKVEVLDVKTGKRIKQINIINCRYITFHEGKAYVSAYLGKVGDPKAPNGIVAEIDTTALTESRRVDVGRQPEEMAVVGQKLYVANSGGYSPRNYERTVSVIDLSSFTVTKLIDVAINLDRLKADRYGDLYVTSRGNYYDIPSKLFVIDTQTDQVKKTFDFGVSNLAIDGDTAYFYSTEWSYNTGRNTITYGMLDVKNETVLNTRFITDGTDQKIAIPYGIAIHPITKEVLVTDAGNYVSPGTLYCFDTSGKKKWSVTTGDIPAHFAFIYK